MVNLGFVAAINGVRSTPLIRIRTAAGSSRLIQVLQLAAEN